MNQVGKVVNLREGEHEEEARLRIFGPYQNMTETEFRAFDNSDDEDDQESQWDVTETGPSLGGRGPRDPDPDGGGIGAA